MNYPLTQQTKQRPNAGDSQFNQPKNLKPKRRDRLSPLPFSYALTASIHVAKAIRGFTITISLYSRRQYFDGAIFHDKDAVSEQRAWLGGYQRACELAGGRRVFIAQEVEKERRAAA